MSYIKSNLLPGEEVNVYMQQSKWVLAPVALPALLGVVLIFDEVSRGMAIFFLIVSAFFILRWLSFEFAITNKRVITKKGILSTETNEISIQKIESVSMKKSMTMPYGDVIIQGTGGKDVLFNKIESPQKIRDILFTELEKRI